jgi:hypothetical protein
MKFSLVFFLLVSPSVFAANKVAVVKLLRGQANVLTMGKTEPLKVDQWVEDGSVIKTSVKSFVKLVFIDKSQMNLGPSSEMKIEKFDGKEASVIDLVKGKVRSQVTKDYLQIKDQEKSKMFIKTPNAVLGVRGTDFLVSTNGQNSATVLFEGSVVFNNLTDRGSLSIDKLEDIVERGVRINPGEFSVVEVDRQMPTVPSVLNVKQRETLESNTTFDSGRQPSSAAVESAKSIVPEGLSGLSVSNTSQTLKTEVAQISAAQPAPVASGVATNAQGFISGNSVKPANGSFLHIESGTVIPPAADSIFDSNTNSFIPAPGNGKVATDGSFEPPANVQITTEGKVLMIIKTETGMKTVEVARPQPIVSAASMSLTQVSQIVASNPTLISASGPIALNQTPPVTTLPQTSLAPPVSGGIDLNTAVIQRLNGRLNIDVIK